MNMVMEWIRGHGMIKEDVDFPHRYVEIFGDASGNAGA